MFIIFVVLKFKQVKQQLYEAGFECDFNGDSGTTLNKKVRNAQLYNYNFILVIGEKEQQTNTVNVRTRDNKVHGQVSVDEVLKRFKRLADVKTNKAEEEFGEGDETATATAGVKDAKLDDSSSSSSAAAAAEGKMDPAKYC